MWLMRGVLRRRKDFVKKGTEVHFSVFIENRNWELKFVFRFDNENEKRKKSKFYFFFKKKSSVPFDPRIKFFLNLFWFKTKFEKRKSNFSNSFFDFKSKSEFQKVLSFFNFGYEIEKWKKEKFFKICFVFKSKDELYFRYTNYKTKWFFDFQNDWTLKLKMKFVLRFSF